MKEAAIKDMIFNPLIIVEIPIKQIIPSKVNYEIYDKDDSAALKALINDINKKGQLDPIVLSLDDVIISGHRRYAACMELELETMFVRYYQILSTNPDFVDLLISFNNHRVKNTKEVLAEKIVKSMEEGENAYNILKGWRKEASKVNLGSAGEEFIEISGAKTRTKITDRKRPLLKEIIKILKNSPYQMTVRQVHYALVSLESPPLKNADDPDSVYYNDRKSYQELSRLLTAARVLGEIPFNWIRDSTRPYIDYEVFKAVRDFIDDEVEDFLKGYQRDVLQSQPNYIVVVCEKDTLSDIIENATSRYTIPLIIGRGYASIDARYKLYSNYHVSSKDKLVILFVSDHDPDGEEIAKSFVRSMIDDFGISEEKVQGIKIALTREQAVKMNLPINMKAKETSTRYKSYIDRFDDDSAWEADAIPLKKLEKIVDKAIRQVLDIEAYNGEIQKEKEEAEELINTRYAILGYVRKHRKNDKKEGKLFNLPKSKDSGDDDEGFLEDVNIDDSYFDFGNVDTDGDIDDSD